MKWIPVSEGLPDPGRQVPAMRPNGTWDRAECNPIYFDGLPAWYMPEGPSNDITHWLDIPEFPTKQEKLDALVSDVCSGISEPMTLDELVEYVGGRYYSAELALKHSLLILQREQQRIKPYYGA